MLQKLHRQLIQRCSIDEECSTGKTANRDPEKGTHSNYLSRTPIEVRMSAEAEHFHDLDNPRHLVDITDIGNDVVRWRPLQLISHHSQDFLLLHRAYPSRHTTSANPLTPASLISTIHLPFTHPDSLSRFTAFWTVLEEPENLERWWSIGLVDKCASRCRAPLAAHLLNSFPKLPPSSKRSDVWPGSVTNRALQSRSRPHRNRHHLRALNSPQLMINTMGKSWQQLNLTLRPIRTTRHPRTESLVIC